LGESTPRELSAQAAAAFQDESRWPNPVFRLRIAGRLLEIFQGTVLGEVRLDGNLIIRGDNATEIAPWREFVRQFGPVEPFDDLVLLRWDGPGSACDGYGFTFLGINEDGTFELSDVPYCGGPPPIVTASRTQVTIEVPPHAPNRGNGWIPGEKWIYSHSRVRRLFPRRGAK
jgi:hypothetical protein